MLKEIIKPVRLDRFAIKNMRDYGKETIEQRALPDFRDGLKPVQRLSLWAAHALGIDSKGGYKKSARVVGDVLGKFHPHGDMSVYDAIVNMVNCPQQLVQGQGNWGTLNTQAAHYRYTEMRLSAFSDAVLFSPAHLEVAEYVNNYDGSETEPVILPSLLPNLLINGAEGIAVGVVVGIPPFTTKSVAKVLERVLENKELNVNHLNKYLELNFKYGGVLHDPERLRLFMSTGQSAISILPNYVYDPSKYLITITGGGPYVSTDKIISKMHTFDIVTKVDDHTAIKSGGLKIQVYLRHVDEAASAVPILMKSISDNMTLRMNLTERLYANDSRYTIDNTVDFFSTTVINYLKLWTTWRLELESKAQLQIASNLDKKVQNTALLIYAANNLDKIFKVLKAKEDRVAERLAEALKISLEDANFLRQRAIGSFAALNTDKLIKDKAEYEKASKAAKSIAKDPTNHVITSAHKLAGEFNK